MDVFKEEKEIKRVIFNVDKELANRLERAKECAKLIGKRLDVDNAVDKTLEKFLKKAERKFQDLGINLETVSYEKDELENPLPDEEKLTISTEKTENKKEDLRENNNPATLKGENHGTQ
ncbi:MAG: hypothetical protein U9N63_10650 [Pseudomonadota bacterium]|nr:hypothetical protein [Pseudomonadota bacterium]